MPTSLRRQHLRPTGTGGRRLLAVAVAAVTVLAPGQAALAAKPGKAPRLTALRCVPATSSVCRAGVKIEVGDDVALRGKRLARGQRVSFGWSNGKTTAKLRRAPGAWLVRIPKRTKPGTIRVAVKDRRGKRSNQLKLKVVAAAAPQTPDAPVDTPAAGLNAVPPAFEGTGLWVVNLPGADGGAADALIARARAARASTILLRLPDVGGGLGEFSPALAETLRANGVRLCVWQYVFGKDPEAEAAAAVDAIRAGAPCLVINAEEEYRGRYTEARRYMTALRAGAGAGFPIGFTSFPRPGSDPMVPYSVFLGPGGAQVNMPQVYWRTAQLSVAELSQQAAQGHRIYGRPIAPLGQTYEGASFEDAQLFRSIWSAYGAKGLGWYHWSITEQGVWDALAQPAPVFDPPQSAGWPKFQQGASGDGVRWMQRLLATLDDGVEVDGQFGPGTEAALRRFQVSRGLQSTGGTGPQTWGELLTLIPKLRS